MAASKPPAKTKLCKNHPTRAGKYPGPRCYSCHNERKREIRLANHGRRTLTTYGITPEQYRTLYEFQGRVCIGCGRAKGNPDGDPRKRNLAVDHDHSCCPGPTSCGRCARMLLCGPCNDVLAHFRDDPKALRRLADALEHWPSRAAGVVPGPTRSV